MADWGLRIPDFCFLLFLFGVACKIPGRQPYWSLMAADSTGPDARASKPRQTETLYAKDHYEEAFENLGGCGGCFGGGDGGAVHGPRRRLA
jgi:hypothetical protein